jgi:hypothetical protein
MVIRPFGRGVAASRGGVAVGQGGGDRVLADQVVLPPQVQPAVAVNQTDPPSPWEHSRAKAYLANRLENRDDPIYVQNMKSEAVWNLNPGLFHRYNKALFKSNYRTLRKKIVLERDGVDFDAEAFRQEQQAFPRAELTKRGHLFWDRSEAQRLLREELGDEGLSSEELSNLKATDLYNGENKVEYQKFPIKIFRNHFYKVKTNLKAGVFWQQKRNRKGRQQYERDAVEETKEE